MKKRNKIAFYENNNVPITDEIRNELMSDMLLELFESISQEEKYD